MQGQSWLWGSQIADSKNSLVFPNDAPVSVKHFQVEK